ncbi:MAG: hypothetical protein K0R25_1255 [Rickettsiaceae bacterium]|jgi:uncharacterized protein YecT (DUF1311 family)|nr:hypothetical protein [Rickettsiaceae bacterium]
MNRIFYSLLLVIFTFFADNSLAFDCKKASSKLERLICSDEELTRKDDHYNKVYQAALYKLSQNEAMVLKKKIGALLKARNDCVILHKKPTKNRSYEVVSREGKKEYIIGDLDLEIAIRVFVPTENLFRLNDKNLQKGCLMTWYDSISSAIVFNSNYQDLFFIPSYKDYVASLNLYGLPYIFEKNEIGEEEIKNCKKRYKNEKDHNCSSIAEDGIKIRKSFSYTLFFPAKEKRFLKINNYESINGGKSYNNYADVSSSFIVGKYRVTTVDSSSLMQDPAVINGNIYLPEIGGKLTLFLATILKEFQEPNHQIPPLYYDGNNHLSTLYSLKNNIEEYVIFTKEYFSDKHHSFLGIKDPHIKECFFNAINDNKEQTEDRGDNLIFVKESKIFSIIHKAKSDCLKDLVVDRS